MITSTDPIGLMIFLGILSLLPIFFILTTSFIKIAMVMLLARDSLGVQQIPPNIVIYGLSLILSFYIMGPVYNKSYLAVQDDINNGTAITSAVLLKDYAASSEGIKQFLIKKSTNNDRIFFYKSLKKFWTPEMMTHVKQDDLIILVPSFMISELSQAFKIGFLIYLPSIMIDLIISNMLMAMGMMMMSPVTISLPIKLLLFISLDGWPRLIQVIMNSYS